ncbi:HalOD1 output domain-containing protein [Halobellus sp. EA9]|uniref:HalOD1 output domain-containing protein n=1 Tax=Halobellus sp. EA9 TaxID=3421647 RepID=UPI003EB7B999
MTERTDHLAGGGSWHWKTVAHHDFDGPDELDATILSALDGEESLDGRQLYTDVDTEPAERFLSSVRNDDASVVFSMSNRTVRVSADGTVEIRTARAGMHS